jgi:hypothetical protein
MVIFGSVIIQKKNNLWGRYWINQDSWYLMIYQWVRWRHDVMICDVCRTWLMPTNLKHLVASIGWHPHAAWSFQDVGPWFWGFGTMIFRQNLTIVESVKSLKAVGPVMDGPSVFPDTRWEKKGPWRSLQRETFVIPTSQLKTTTHIFRNLNRWKIDRNGHDLDLARQRAAGCGCCWSLGRCTTGQPGGGWGIYLAFLLMLLGQRALGRLCSSFGSLKWGGIHQQYPVHYIINFIQFHILYYYYYNIII